MAAPAPDYGPFFQASGQIHDIDPLLLQAIQMHEDASGDPNAVGPPNKSGELARGPMQFLPSTAAKYGVTPNDPGSSILGAGAYLADLRKATNDNLPAMLAQYGGGNATGYANSVLGTYRQLQASWGLNAPVDDKGDQSSAAPPTATSGDQGGIKITARALPGTGGAQQGGASFVPPPSTPDTLGRSNAPGSRAQHPMEAGEYGNTPPADFRGALFGQPPQPQQAQATTPSAADQQPPDFRGALFGAPPPAAPTQTAGAPAAAPAPSAPAAPVAAGQPGTVAPPAVAAPPPPPPAPATPAAAPPNALTAPSPPSWWQRNVAIPFTAMDDPRIQTPQPFLNQPALQSIGAGLGQGVRDVGTTLNNVGSWADANVPGVGALDRAIGFTPEQAAATKSQEAAETQAYERQYPGDWEAMAGRFAGNMLAAPVGGLARGVGAGAEAALPEIAGRFLAPAAQWGTAGGLQNMLSSGGETPQDWQRNFEVGGLGSAVLGFGTRGLGAVLGRATGALQQKAQDLGFNLSIGDLRGGLAKAIESFTQYLPFSGNAAYQAANKANVARILNRNMGVAGDHISLDTMAQARANAGSLMDRIDNVTVDPGKDGQLLTDLAQIHQEAADQQLAPITNMVDAIQNTAAAHGGVLPGDVLHNLYKTGTTLDNLVESNNSVLAQFGQRIKSALTESVSRASDPAIYGTEAAAANAPAVADFNRGRYYWKTISTVQPLVNRTGDPADATYTALGNRILGTPANPNFDPMFQRGNNEMADLAHVLHGVLPDLKSTGTGRENWIARLIGLGGPGAAELVNYFTPAGLEHYVTNVLVPAFGLGQVGRVMRRGLSAPENYLMQRAVGPYIGNPLMNQIAPQSGPNPAAPQ